MIGFGFLASRSVLQNALEDFMREHTSDNVTDKEKYILEHLNNQLRTSEKSSSKRCPKCQQYFHILYINSVEIDCCKNCESLWIDPGELKLITAADEDITANFLFAGKSDYNCPVCQSRLRKRSVTIQRKK